LPHNTIGTSKQDNLPTSNANFNMAIVHKESNNDIIATNNGQRSNVVKRHIIRVVKSNNFTFINSSIEKVKARRGKKGDSVLDESMVQDVE